MTYSPPLSKRVIASLNARSETRQWEELIANLLRRLELDPEDRARAEDDYAELADRLAEKLSIPRHDVHIFPQGSMRTQTTISQRYPVNFDLDLVVKLSGPKYDSPNPEVMFEAFGKALEGNEAVELIEIAPARRNGAPRANVADFVVLAPAFFSREAVARPW